MIYLDLPNIITQFESEYCSIFIKYINIALTFFGTSKRYFLFPFILPVFWEKLYNVLSQSMCQVRVKGHLKNVPDYSELSSNCYVEVMNWGGHI